MSNAFFTKINDNNLELLDLLFRRNEREALGRRLLIMAYIIEGYNYREIQASLGCGVETINSVSKIIQKYNERDKKKILKFIASVFKKQLPRKNSKYPKGYTEGSRVFVSLLERNIRLKGTKDKPVPLI